MSARALGSWSRPSRSPGTGRRTCFAAPGFRRPLRGLVVRCRIPRVRFASPWASPRHPLRGLKTFPGLYPVICFADCRNRAGSTSRHEEGNLPPTTLDQRRPSGFRSGRAVLIPCTSVVGLSGFGGRVCPTASEVSFRCMKVRALIRLLEKDGWYLHATRGSHRQFKHPVKPGRVTVPGKLSDDLARATLSSAFKQAQLKGD